MSALSLSVTLADGLVDPSLAVAAATSLIGAVEGPQRSGDIATQLGLIPSNIGRVSAQDHESPAAHYFYAANEGQLIVGAVGIANR